MDQTSDSDEIGGMMGNSVEIGSKFSKRDAPDYVLEVVEMLKLDGELPHARARVSVCSNDLGIRLYSLSALEDSRLFVTRNDE
jgi:hypothetical protein